MSYSSPEWQRVPSKAPPAPEAALKHISLSLSLQPNDEASGKGLLVGRSAAEVATLLPKLILIHLYPVPVGFNQKEESSRTE